MSIRLAVIGAGIMGADHARIIARDLPGAILQVVCDADEARARDIADQNDAAHTSTDPQATIARPDVDAILIASPDHTHAELSLACINAGKPVLCEKPLSPDPNECLAVIAAETAQNRQVVQTGFMRRYDPSYTEMKTALTDGILGAPLMMHNFHRNVDAPAFFTGQMAITNSAPHEFDVARFILDTDYTAISVFQPARTGSTTVPPVFMVLETKGGQLVNIEINNNAAYGYDVRGELVGEKGTVCLNTPIYARYNLALEARERYAADWRPRYAKAYRLQNQDFLRFVQTGIFPATAANAWDGYAAALTAECGVRALDQGTRIKIEAAEMPPLYRR